MKRSTRRARIRAKLEEENLTGDLEWWWLSFVHEDRPEGDRFVGACIVQARGMGNAVRVAHVLGINPGGEVAGLTFERDRVPPAKWRERLLSRQEISEMEKEAPPTASG